MTLIVPNNGRQIILNRLITQPIFLRLYSNNKTPAAGDIEANYTEVVGGGYTARQLTYPDWTITTGEPSSIISNNFIYFNFTGNIGGPNLIYGYYLVSFSGIIGSSLLLAERFSQSFIAGINHYIGIKPHLALNNG